MTTLDLDQEQFCICCNLWGPAETIPRGCLSRISLSSVRSEIAFLSRKFSVSSSLSRFTWSRLQEPPYSLRQR